MTANDAHAVAVKYTQLNARNFYIFIAVGLAFGGWTVLSADVNETDAYADMRKVMGIGYTLIAVTLLMLTLKFMARSNAALRMAQDLFRAGTGGEVSELHGFFRPTSMLWALFPMAAMIIVVNYIILIYAVDGGLF